MKFPKIDLLSFGLGVGVGAVGLFILTAQGLMRLGEKDPNLLPYLQKDEML